MPACVLCSEVTATDGGLEVHMGRVHAPPPRVAKPARVAPPRKAPARPKPAPPRPPRPPRRWPFPGIDGTIPLTALMILALLIGAIVAAVRM